MKRAVLLIVIPALLVALGFAQAPAAAINTDQTIRGCLNGSDGNYTIVEDSTGHIFKITTTSVGFKQHLGHDVALIGRTAMGQSSAAPDNSFAVTELNMISDHCDAATAAPIATASAPSETTGIPPASAVAPAATTSTVAENTIAPTAEATPSAEIVGTPVATVAPPAETVVTPVATVPSPAGIVVTPPATVSAPPETVSQHAAGARRRSEAPPAATTAPDVTASSSSENASTPDVVATQTSATSLSSETARTPAGAATTPAVTSRGWSMSFLIAFAVLVIVLGTMAPVISRWRKRRLLERTGAQNLSFTREANSDEKTENSRPRKAA